MNRTWMDRSLLGDLGIALLMGLCCWVCLWQTDGGYPMVSWTPETGLVLLALNRQRQLRASVLGLAAMTIGYTAAGGGLAPSVVLAVLALAAGWLCRALYAWWRRTGLRPIASLVLSATMAAAGVALAEICWITAFHAGLDAAGLRLVGVNLVARDTGLVLVGCGFLLPQARYVEHSTCFVRRMVTVVHPVLLLICAVMVFTLGSYPFTFLPMLLIVFAAVQFPLRMLQAELLFLTLVVAVASRTGRGPFGGMGSVMTSPELVRVEIAEGFNLCITLVGVLLAVYVTASRIQSRALEHSAGLQQEMLDASVVGMMILTRTGGPSGRFDEVRQTNLIARELFGIDDEPVAATRLLERIAPEDQELATARLLDVVNGTSRRETVEFWLQTGCDGWRRISTTMTAMSVEGQSEPEHISFQLIDVTEQHAVERELTERALHDPLTGLGNRTLLEDRMDYWRDINGRQGTCSLVVYIDLDAFKTINDTHGHDVGDAVLVEVARRMQSVVRPQDTVVRLGGDEFVVLMPELPLGQPDIFDQMVARLRDVVCRPMTMEWGELPIGASFGTAVSDALTSQDTLLRRADKSMYAAKALNRLAQVPAQRATPVVASVPLPVIGMGEIRTALRESQFELFVQPLVELPSRRILGGEALIRWHHPTRGLLGPDAWLGLVEGSELSGELGSWVIGESCRIAAQWRDALGDSSPVMHANISASQLGNGTLVRDVREALRQTGLVPDKLVIELTETQLDLSPDAVNNEIGALRDAGVALAADDFGTGYSSLTRLTDMPIDIMKIDRTFVGRMADDERARAVVAAVLAMGNELGLEVVAEGVETESQAIDLREMGCTVAQGFLWSRAVRADEFLRLAQGHVTEGIVVPAP